MILSIIIPTYNEEYYLPLLLESIKKQNFKDYEIIIADNNSKDKTKKIANRFGCKIVKGGLPATGRNNGAKIAKGDYILFLDADIILPKNFLNELLREFKRKKLDITTCNIIPAEKRKRDYILFALANVFVGTLQFFKPVGGGYCILVKRALHDRYKGFNESAFLGEDWDYINRISKNHKFRVLNKPKVYLSARRLEKEGRMKLTLKYAKTGYLQITKKNMILDKKVVDYEFGCFSKK